MRCGTSGSKGTRARCSNHWRNKRAAGRAKRTLPRYGVPSGRHWLARKPIACDQIRGHEFSRFGNSANRAIVCQHIGNLKTEIQKADCNGRTFSCCAVGLESALPLQSRRGLRLRFKCRKTAGDRIAVSSAMSKHIRPATKRAGILKRVGWQFFRRSFATLLMGNNEGTKTIQESLRTRIAKRWTRTRKG